MKKIILLTFIFTISCLSLFNTQAAAEKYGGQIVLASIADASTLNPAIESDSSSNNINNLVFDSLIRLDEQLQPQASLAENWTISDDNKTITFKLKKNVKFHDGVEFTAEDVEFTIFSIVDYKSNSMIKPYYDSLLGAEEYFNKISQLNKLREENVISAEEFTEDAEKAFKDFKNAGGIKIIDPYQIEFNLAEPFAPFITVALDLGILPRHILEGKDINRNQFNTNPIGTGPFKFIEWKRNEHIVLEAFEDYHQGRPYLDRVIYRIIPDQAVQITELRTGGIDYMTQPPPEMIAILENDPDLNILQTDTVSYNYFGFKLSDSIFEDIKFRQALSYAIDMESIVENILMGYGQVATGPFPTSMWAYNPDVKRYPYNPELASKILAEMGWQKNQAGFLEKNGEILSFKLETRQGDYLKEQMAVIVQEQLADIGIKVEVVFAEWTSFLVRLLNANYESVILNWRGSADPDGYAYTVWHSSQFDVRNNKRYKNERVDELLVKARREMNLEKRKIYYDEFQEILAEEQPFIFAYYVDQVFVVNDDYKGWVPTPQREGILLSLKNVYLEN